MKFFTIEWWSGETNYDASIFDRYQIFINSFLDRLPADHRRLATELSLHDAHLLNLVAALDRRTVQLHLDGRGFNATNKSYFGRRFTLTYSGVTKIETTANPTKGLPGPHGFGDLGYDEIELLDSGSIEHRMLFSTGIVLSIQHSDFSIALDDYEWE
jgi:hypothetical protein